jgi:hypothetical protein
MITDNDRLRLSAQIGPLATSANTPRTQPDAVGGILLGVTAAHSGSYPTETQKFYRVNIVNALGEEAVGEAIVAEATTAYVFAAHIGNDVPPEGTRVILRNVPYRWVFRYDAV